MATRDEPETIKIEEAEILFLNFSGAEDKFNAEGDRNFCVLLTDEVAHDMAANGWNVKYLRPREEGDEPRPYVQVKVSYKARPPKVVMIAGGTRTQMTQEMVGTLDFAEIISTDLIIVAYNWDVNGKQGKKAYLRTMYVTVFQDELEEKWEG